MKYIDKLNYVNEAEKAIKNLVNNDGSIELTTSKIRNILMLVSDIYNDAIREKNEELSDEMVARINYIKMRLVYEIGRDRADSKGFGVEKFAKKAHLIEIIESIDKNRGNLILFCRYMEALVAYHKYYGGKENSR